jgi:hypothetical protein
MRRQQNLGIARRCKGRVTQCHGRNTCTSKKQSRWLSYDLVRAHENFGYVREMGLMPVNSRLVCVFHFFPLQVLEALTRQTGCVLQSVYTS